jgi:hypothetical protein
MTCTGGGRDDQVAAMTVPAALARLEDRAASDRLLRRLVG